MICTSYGKRADPSKTTAKRAVMYDSPAEKAAAEQ